MKHLFTMLLALIVATASAQDFEKGGIYYRVLSEDDRTVMVISGADEYKGDIVIPEEVIYDSKVYLVTTIRDGAFRLCSALTSVSMPSVTTIGDKAFSSCSALTSVSMPSVTTIGNSAFYYCWNLTSVSMPAVTTIGDEAFNSCSALTSVHIPASCTSIAGNPFQRCGSLEEIVVDENNPNYSSMDGVLYDKYMSTLIACPGKKSSIDMSSSVTTIGDWAFGWSGGLTSVSMPSVKTIGDNAFYMCANLTSVDIPASCTSIAGNPFQGCKSLEEIVVDENNPNYSSADGVLYDKDKTTLISWPAAEGDIDILPSVTTIGEEAFIYCFALTSVSMPSVTTIGDYAFNACSALTSVSMPSVTTIGDYAFCSCDALTSVSMPSVTTIGYEAFWSCNALTSVSMPEVTTIGDQAFRECSALASVSMPSVTTIGHYAFNSCYALTSVSMPSVTTIGDYAFYYCSALTSVSMPSVTTIGDDSFYYCNALTSLDIPASVTTIGKYAFSGCSSLTSVYCHWEQPLECNPGFGYNVYEDATLYVPTGTIDAYRNVYPWSEFINIVEKDYSGIADTPQSEVTVRVIDGAISIEGGDGTASAPVVEVYSAGGQCIYRGTDSSIGGLTHGVYVVKVGGTVQKVAL